MLTRWIVRQTLQVGWAVAFLYLSIQVATILLNPPIPWDTAVRTAILSAAAVLSTGALGSLVGRWLRRKAAPIDTPGWPGAHSIWEPFGDVRYWVELQRSGIPADEIRRRRFELWSRQAAVTGWIGRILLPLLVFPLFWGWAFQPFLPEGPRSLLGLAVVLPQFAYVSGVSFGYSLGGADA